MPQAFALIAKYNPLSCGADLARSFLLRNQSIEVFMPLDLMVFALIFASAALFAYMKIMQK